ncbi:uncharacterized protein LOC124366530 [Homalodisca vitripennis]|uniref:uncharacterized protein LOC124366530 n=1 Tax=Homalodisca vitripennis TaxID=197043 RepID=UPI001EECC328|nr:uncharacterized protein LOC124366530 [Homalodisca vitripennis]
MMAVAASSRSRIHVRRHPRYLVWAPGLGNKLQIICGFGVPIDAPRTSLTYGLILKTNYILPNNATHFVDPYVAFARRGVGASRWHLYKVAESLLSRLGLGGRSCLLRSVCEAAETPLEHNGILGELLHVLLTPTSTQDEPIDATAREYYTAERQGRAMQHNLNSSSSSGSDCTSLYPDCETGLLDLVTTLVSDSVRSLFLK